ncbi:MAG: 3-isopropylmalate dehydratase large subunit [Comamonadaceae bacterium]|nr:MAG: 3-isopropylmalate dehydratase large subunit [Comamonadaceae bacterium]
MTEPRTLFAKIWDSHAIVTRGADEALLAVDTHFVHEGSFHAFGALAKEGRKVRRPRQVFGSPDHFVPTRNRELGLQGIADAESRGLVEYLATNAGNYGFDHFGVDDDRQGVIHVIGPELGITQPGLVLTCGDSHTSTHGAFGCYALGIGASQGKQILATQCVWQKRPKTLRIRIDGTPGFGVTAKDIVLTVIARIGVAGAVGHVIEFAGDTVERMTMDERMTLCNMATEAGARSGMVAPDATTIAYLQGRPYAPAGAMWDLAVAHWRTLASDPGAAYDREVAIDAAGVEPSLTWGTLPDQVLPVGAAVPAADDATPQQRAQVEEALAYMGLQPGERLEGTEVHRVFIGSCTNGRLDDLRAAAAVFKGRTARVPTWIAPGSTAVKKAAEAEGLDRVFRAAGVDWRGAGCSSCAAMNGDTIAAGERCASTSNRNFEGRQGKGSRTHLMSPAMAAAASVTGRITDVRKLAAGG